MEIESFKTKIALLVGRSSGGSGLETLPKLNSDFKVMQEGLIEMGFDESEIFEIKNRNNSDLVDDIGSD